MNSLRDNPLHLIVLSSDPTVRQTVSNLDGPWRVDFAGEPSEALSVLTAATAAAVIDESVTGPGAYVALARRMRREAPTLDVSVVGGPKSDEVLRSEWREGVDLYVARPFDARTLSTVLGHRLAVVALKARAGIVGRSPAVEQVVETILQVAPTEVPVLIEGESGTGKDVVARAIHAHSRRADRPLESINCGAVAEGVLESELFGHERGAFTGAVARRAGLFERANGGTVFLDEVGEMSPAMQVRLLRVLETGEVMRVGGVSAFTVDVRVIAATNRDLAGAVRDGAFRQDLYYRLRGISLRLPPLRERREDIPLLAGHFLAQAAERHHKNVRGFDDAAMRRLVAWNWPGNVRELRNVVDTLVVLARGSRIDATLVEGMLGEAGEPAPARLPVPVQRPTDQAEREMIYASVLALHRDVREILERVRALEQRAELATMREVRPEPESVFGEDLRLDRLERAALVEALRRTGGNRRRAAEALGISERTLYRKIREYGIA